MSGGAWGYQQQEIREEALSVKNSLEFLAQIEEELDWGVSCDTCLDCAKIRVCAGLIQFFEDHRGGETAFSVLTDHQQNLCATCESRVKK